MVESIGADLDAIREQVLRQRGAADADYIRRVIRLQRCLDLGSRLLLLVASRRRGARAAGTLGLTLAKILDNMWIGHNVLHGQWDWMRDPRIHSASWEWDHATPAELWKRSHNQGHHKYTNILGKDNDLGYGIMLVADEQPWTRRHLEQPFLNLVNALVFEYGIAAYDLGLGELSRSRAVRTEQFDRDLRATMRKIGRQAAKDYVLWPALSGRAFSATLGANLVANLLRNVWSHSVIMCGHFPEGVEAFEQDSVAADETRGSWYVRQMLGSADITGPPLLHLLTGNLSHQIEHHLFPDLPSNRYAEIAPRVRQVFERHGLRYHAAPLPRQLGSAWGKVLRLSLPDDWWSTVTWRSLPRRARDLVAAPTRRRADPAVQPQVPQNVR